MTMINPYGIGAGRVISEQYEADPENDRKEIRRRLTTAQLAEQERLKARLHRHSPEYLATDQSQDAASSMSNSLRPLCKPHTLQSQQVGELNDDEWLSESGQDELAAHPANPKKSLLASPTVEAGSQYDGMMPDAVRGGRLLDSLLVDIRNSPAKLTRERALSSLMSLNDSLRSRRNPDISQEDNDGVLGYLEFLDGYFESGAKSAVHSEKITTLMSEIRLQLNLAADPGRAGILQHAAIANQIKTPTEAVPAVSARESRKISKRGRIGVDDEEEVDGHSERKAESVIPLPPTGTPAGGSASQSSQNKDSSRKRDETIVSVTLRSV